MENNDENIYYFEIDFKTWKRYLRNFINKQRLELLLYLTSLKESQDPNLITYLKQRIYNVKRAILENEIMLKLAEICKDEYMFYITSDGYPVMRLVGKERKEELRKQKKFLRLRYV